MINHFYTQGNPATARGRNLFFTQNMRFSRRSAPKNDRQS